MALGMTMPVCWSVKRSPAVVQTDTSQQLVDCWIDIHFYTDFHLQWSLQRMDPTDLCSPNFPSNATMSLTFVVQSKLSWQLNPYLYSKDFEYSMKIPCQSKIATAILIIGG